ncbi:pro-neuregulin-1, membrane-bound isoform isoform X1 [Chanos chanos]|uniref:Pro-neuregulin-1, membrane-bound isoform n=1 Tax=Chanos chanos TaxID=29144 RepID=A0A6J2UX51_CHACN|nr:pro-neuregulin-1, membrane-bound isoform isoform X1 [Chanos chanos]
MESEGVKDSSAGFCASPESVSPEGDAGSGPETSPEEGPEAGVPGEGEGEGERGPLGCLGLAAASCCVCVDMEQVRGCVRSEKICILPILACLLSLALCTAGLKWVFVDKIFEYEPPTHLDPKRIGQDPVIFADPTRDLPVSFPHPTSARTPMITAGWPEVFVEGKSTAGPFAPLSPKTTIFTPTSAVTIHMNPGSQPGTPSSFRPDKNDMTPQYPSPTVESNDIHVPKLPATSTTPSVKTSSHVSRCSESEKDYCVNGGECYTLEVTPGSTKFLCRCPRGYTGNRCQTTDPVRVINQKQTEELYQKRVLTITGICIALLVVGIMCVVAYCKTKKQRKKLHDRLRQTLRERNAMASMANGCQAPSQPPDNIQLVNQYMTKSAIPTQHVIKKETETSFSTSQYTSSTQQSTPVTHTSSQCWSNGKNESVVSDSQSVLVMSSAENSRHGTPSYRGRLNATGGTRELSAYLKSSRETPESFRDSPYSERYVSAMTTPTHLSPVNLLSPVTPSSPPSESSVQLTSLAMSVPSMATSPSGEEERPLLFITSPQLRDKQHQEQSRNQYQRNSAHYNHGLEDSSPLPSSLCIVEDDEYESTQEYDASNTTTPQSPSDKVPNARAKRTKPSAPQTGQAAEQASSSSSSESSSSESETEDERVGEDTPFLSIQNPLAGSLEGDSSRTNPALRLSPQDDLQARLTSVMANQDPIAV